MNTFLGAATELSPEDIDPKVIGAARVTYIEGYQWDTAQAKAAIRKASKEARAAGRQVALSLSIPLWWNGTAPISSSSSATGSTSCSATKRKSAAW